jgi:hypothetical protein
MASTAKSKARLRKPQSVIHFDSLMAAPVATERIKPGLRHGKFLDQLLTQMRLTERTARHALIVEDFLDGLAVAIFDTAPDPCRD